MDKHNYRLYVARVQDSGVVYVQNRTFTSTHTVTGENIMVGEKVATAQPQGKVVVKSGANVTMKASDTTTLEAARKEACWKSLHYDHVWRFGKPDEIDGVFCVFSGISRIAEVLNVSRRELLRP